MTKTFTIETVGVPNGNNRIYTKECIEKAISDARELIESKRFLGELQYVTHSSVVDLRNVSHLVEDLRLEGNELKADIQPLNLAKGIALQSMIEENRVKFVMRGLGTIDKNNVVQDYTLLSIDAVPNFNL
jgi:hypothetical protein